MRDASAAPVAAAQLVTRLPLLRRPSTIKADLGDPPLALGTRLLNASRCGSYGFTWHCAQAKSGHVVRAYQELVRQGFGAFVPLHQRRPKSLHLEPLFGTYLFVAFNVADPYWRAIPNTKGVARLLIAGERPLMVRPGVMEELIARGAAASGAVDDSPLPRQPQPGDRVQAVWGGQVFEGICQLSTKQRVTLLYECLGGLRPLSVPLRAVTPMT